MPTKSLSLNYRIGADYGDLRRKMEEANSLTRAQRSELSKLEAQQRKHREAMTSLGKGMLAFGVAAAAGLGLAARESIKWESAFTGVRKTVSGSDKEIAALEGELRNLAKTLPATHEEIAGVAEAAGQLGIAREDVTEFTRTMIDLGETTNLTADEAASSLAKFSNIMGTSASDVDRLGSALVALGNNGASTEADIVAMGLRIAGAGRQIGLSESDVLAFASSLSSVGIEAEAGGSAFSRVMVDMQMAVNKGGEHLQQFASVAGMSATKFATLYKKDATSAIIAFVQGLGKMQARGGDVLGTLESLGFSQIRVRDTLLRAAGASDMFTQSIRTGSNAWAENTALAEEAEKRYATAEARLQVAGNQIRDVMIDVGAVIVPILAQGAEGIANLIGWWQSLPGPVKTAVTVLGAVTAAVTVLGGAALIAVPKLLAFRESMTSLAATGGAVTGALGRFGLFMAGPWGAAIALGITALTAFGMAQGDAASKADAFTFALDAQTGAISRSSIEEFYKQIADGAFIAGENSARVKDVLQDLGLTVEDVIGYLSGQKDAQEKVNAALQSGAQTVPIFKHWLDRTKGSYDRQIQASREAESTSKKYGGAQRDTAAATGLNAQMQDQLSGALGGATSAADQAANALANLYSRTFGAEETSDDFYSTLNRLGAQFKSTSSATDSGTRSNDRHRESLERVRDITKDTRKQLQDLAQAQRDAEKAAREAAEQEQQRRLDELFGKQFDRQSTRDAFRSQLAQLQEDVEAATKEKTPGARSLRGDTEGALANRERMRSLVQSAQAVIQGEKDRGASKQRIRKVTADLTRDLRAEALGLGFTRGEVDQYTKAIQKYGVTANTKVRPELEKVREEYAKQRKEIRDNASEQIKSAKSYDNVGTSAGGSASAIEGHSAALRGNSEDAIENRGIMRSLVKEAQAEIVEAKKQKKSKEEIEGITKKFIRAIEVEAARHGFNKKEVEKYTGAIMKSAQQVGAFPALRAKASTEQAIRTMKKFTSDVTNELRRIPDEVKIKVKTGMEFVSSKGGGGHYFVGADGGPVHGPGGPRDDVVPALLSNGEYVINAKDTKRNFALLERINNGMPAFADGGLVTLLPRHIRSGVKNTMRDIRSAIRDEARSNSALFGPLGWAASQAGKPYLWGGVGPAGYDCSGFMSSITNVILGRSPYSRLFATGSFPTGMFAPGPGNFMIGSFRGSPGHMAGTLLGTNVESRGGDGVVVGPNARGARDALFGGNLWHLRGFADGGMVRRRAGDPPFDLLDPHGMYARDSYARGTSYVPRDGLYRLHQGEAVVPPGYQLVPKGRALMYAGAARNAATGGGSGGWQGDVHVRVYVGDREITDIVRTEVSETNRGIRRSVGAGVGGMR